MKMGSVRAPLWCASLGLLYRDEEGYIEMEALCVSPDDPFWMGACPVAVNLHCAVRLCAFVASVLMLVCGANFVRVTLAITNA